MAGRGQGGEDHVAVDLTLMKAGVVHGPGEVPLSRLTTAFESPHRGTRYSRSRHSRGVTHRRPMHAHT
jgi:hypothetical protein